MPSEPPMVGAVQLFPRPPITAVYRTATGWDALTTCTVASICCGLPYSQSIRSCLPSDDPPASLRESGCSGASNPSSSGYVLGSLQRPTMADLLSANRDAFGATLRPSLWEGVMKPSNRKSERWDKQHCNHRATSLSKHFSRREIFLPRIRRTHTYDAVCFADTHWLRLQRTNRT